MTQQEAILKPEQLRKNNTYTELYFPKLRSTLHSILTGDNDVITQLAPTQNYDLSILSTKYKEVINDEFDGQHQSVNVQFSVDGLEFILQTKQEDEETKQVKITYMNYYTCTWEKDLQLLTHLGHCLHLLIASCVLSIYKLSKDNKNYKAIQGIESNPLYDQMAFVYALFKKLNLQDELPEMYIRALMAKRQLNYNMLIHVFYTDIILNASVVEWIKKDIITEKTFRNKISVDGVEEITETKSWVLLIPDYLGMKFAIKLSLNSSPKREATFDDRYLNMNYDLNQLSLK